MRAVVTGQIGVDKKSYLERVAQLATDRGETIDVRNVGDLMVAKTAIPIRQRVGSGVLSRKATG